MQLVRPSTLLLAYPAGVLFRATPVIVDHGGAALNLERFLVPCLVAMLAAAVWWNERMTAGPAIIVGTVIGTIEVIGNAVVIPEAIAIARNRPYAGDTAGLYLYLADSAVGLLAGICALAGARLLAIQYGTTPGLRPIRRAALAMAALEGVLMLLIVIFGLGSFTQSWLQFVLLFSQLPAVMLLSAMRWCCGVGGGLVLTDSLHPHWGGLTLIGIPILLITNTGVLVLTIVGMRAVGLGAGRLWRAIQRRSADR